MNSQLYYRRSRKFTKRASNQGGFLLIAALGFIILFSILALFLSQQLTASTRVHVLSALSLQASNAAYSGTQEGVYRLSESNQCPVFQRVFEQPGLKACEVNVVCQESTPHIDTDNERIIYSITSQARCGVQNIYANRSAKVTLIVDANNGYRTLYRSYK